MVQNMSPAGKILLFLLLLFHIAGLFWDLVMMSYGYDRPAGPIGSQC